MVLLVQKERLASLMTEDPFCAQEGVKTLESKLHHEYLVQIEQDLRLHLHRQALPCTLTSDLLIRNVPLQAGLAPDIALWPGWQALAPDVDYGSVELSADLYPALVLEVASESTAAADRDIKHEIYRLAQIAEYWLYDPMGYAEGPSFQGWQLEGAAYVSIAGYLDRVEGQAVTLYPSAALGTTWGLEHETALRLLDPVRREWYRMTPETLQQTEDQLRKERQERVRLQQEIQRLRARLEDRVGGD